MFTTREIRIDEWMAFKNLRLEAVRENESRYTASYAREEAQQDTHWQSMLSASTGRIFGLYDFGDLIGITGVFTDWKDASGRTAILGMSYIRPAYRGLKLSRLLYQARIDWAKQSGLFDHITVGHRLENEVSRRANQAFGFVYTDTEECTFGDGSTGKLLHYEMRI